ncbi:MAG: hypothetical protein ACJAWL_000841 [Motiliproteus sp.]|jgi:hypothetical protein
MNMSQDSKNHNTVKILKKSQPFHIDTYPLTIILTINAGYKSNILCTLNKKTDLSFKDKILDDIKGQLSSYDQAEHLIDYNFRVVINDKTDNKELTDICCKVASNLDSKEKNKNMLLISKRIIIHFITLSELQICMNEKLNNHKIENINNVQARISFDTSATNRHGEILC